MKHSIRDIGLTVFISLPPSLPPSLSLPLPLPPSLPLPLSGSCSRALCPLILSSFPLFQTLIQNTYSRLHKFLKSWEHTHRGTYIHVPYLTEKINAKIKPIVCLYYRPGADIWAEAIMQKCRLESCYFQ